MELSLSRMSDKMTLLEQEKKDSQCLVKDLEEQILILLTENRMLKEDTSEENEKEDISVQEELSEAALFSLK